MENQTAMTNIDPSKTEILDKLLKLLALANSPSAFSGEADNARQMAEALMQKHHITNLDQLAGKPDRNSLAYEQWSPHFPGMQWEFLIADILAHLCGCYSCYYGDLETYTLVGTIANLEAARYLIGEINRQRQRAWLDLKRRGETDRFHSFCFTYAKTLQTKIFPILNNSPALTNAAREAELWYKTSHTVTNVAMLKGQGQSQAGRAAGQAASFSRGAVNPNHRYLPSRK
jgi:hypothetical protein